MIPTMSSAIAPITKPPIITGLLFLDMTCLLGVGASRQETPDLGIGMRIAKLARIALGNCRPGFGVEKQTVASDSEDARELVRHHDHRGAEAVLELEDQ